MNKQATHVLLIEDNPGDADLMRLRLIEGKNPVQVKCVSRLADGLASLSQHLPSVILLDLNLPDSRGSDTFRKVLKMAPDTPVVILSGQEDEVLARKAMNLERNLSSVVRAAAALRVCGQRSGAAGHGQQRSR
jgi:DNA-binding NtrC family response regulator